jgi:hypothetical protein
LAKAEGRRLAHDRSFKSDLQSLPEDAFKTD